MDSPNITWFAKVRSSDKYMSTNNIFAGTYTKKTPVIVDIQLWNNRYGVIDVEDLKDFYINIFFKDTEDSSLLEYCTVVYRNDVLTKDITNKIATLQFPEDIVISGVSNDGSLENHANYINLEFIFNTSDTLLKEDDLKSLYFKIEKNNDI